MAATKDLLFTRVQELEVGPKTTARVLVALTLRVPEGYDSTGAEVLASVSKDGVANIVVTPAPPQSFQVLGNKIEGVDPATKNSETVVFDQTERLPEGAILNMGPGADRAKAYAASGPNMKQALMYGASKIDAPN